MSQYDFGTINPATKTGTQLADDLNNWRSAVHTGHAGVARPSYAVGGMEWIKQVSATLWECYLYDGDTDIFLYSFNPTTNTYTPTSIANGGTGSATAADARTALGLGSIATQAASAVAITGGTITGLTNLTVVESLDGDNVATIDNQSSGTSARSGIVLTAAGGGGGVYYQGSSYSVAVGGTTLGANGMRIHNGAAQPIWLTNYNNIIAKFHAVASAVNFISISSRATGGGPTLYVEGTDTNAGLNLCSKGNGSVNIGTGATSATAFTTQFQVVHVASAVNYVRALGGATANYPALWSDGSDANVGMLLITKGNGLISMRTGNLIAFEVTYTASSVNWAYAFPAITGESAGFGVGGLDANVNMRLLGKGTGVINVNSNLAAGRVQTSSGTSDGVSVERDNGIMHLSANGIEPLWLRRRGSDGNIVSFRRDTTLVGTISVTTTNTAYNTSSDRRLKVWGALRKPCLETLNRLTVHSGYFKANPDKKILLMLADEVQDVLPEVVTGVKDAVREVGNIYSTAAYPLQQNTKKPAVLGENETFILRETKEEDGELQEWGDLFCTEERLLETEVFKPENLGEGRRWEKTGEVIDPQQVDYSAMVPCVVGSVKELSFHFTTFKEEMLAEIASLKARIALVEQ